jgi:hypothetical protein
LAQIGWDPHKLHTEHGLAGWVRTGATERGASGNVGLRAPYYTTGTTESHPLEHALEMPLLCDQQHCEHAPSPRRIPPATIPAISFPPTRVSAVARLGLRLDRERDRHAMARRSSLFSSCTSGSFSALLVFRLPAFVCTNCGRQIY